MKADQFFLKMTTRGEISLRDIAHKITFFQSLARFICLKRLLSLKSKGSFYSNQFTFGN